MEPDGSFLAVTVVIFLALLFAGSFFTAAETAIVSFSDAKLKRLAEENDRRALRLKKVVEHPSAFMNTTQFCFFLCSLGAAGVAVFCFTPCLRQAMFGETPGTAPLIVSALLAFAIAFVCIFVISKMLPYTVATHKPEAFAFAAAPIVRAFMVLLKPAVWLLAALSGLAARLFGVDPKAEPEEVTEEEIRMMMDVGNEKGVIEQSQMDMINNIFDFDDTTAGDIMTHRTDVIAVDTGAKITDLVYIAVNEGFSRIPVYEEDIDNIVGAVYVKDLLSLVGCDSTSGFAVKDFMRPVLYVPESVKCRELFNEFTAKKAHFAVVVDEYGGTSGIVTMEDLLESIVGNIQDEYDDEEEEITRVSDNVFTIDGSAELEDVGKLLGVEFEESDDYDTLGGLIIDHLGRIPSEDEQVSVVIKGIEFTVLLVEDRRIARVKATKLPPEQPGAEDTANEAESETAGQHG